MSTRPLIPLLAVLSAVMLTGCAGGGTSTESSGIAAGMSEPTSTDVANDPVDDAEAPSPEQLQAVDDATALILERLQLADGVAAAKWLSGAPITDTAREQAVLDAAAEAAAQLEADPVYVTAVFADQISASKVVQEQRFAVWTADAALAPTSAPDLANEVRPVLDRITAELVPALAITEQLRSDPTCRDLVQAAWTDAVASTAEDQALVTAGPIALAQLCD